MATIYRAVTRDDRAVALKVVKPDIVRNKTAAARFHREAKAASRLRHPGIVQVLAWGFDKEMPYIAMELVEGEDLFELLDRRGQLSEEETMRIAVKLCEALAAAHAQGVVHRDLKPENIMVTPQPDSAELSVKVLDFGIAKLVGPRPGDLWGDETVPQVLTKVGSAVGTPSHMAPEQARGDAVDGRTDIYACGVLLYEMVTGHLPFEGDNPLHVAIRQVRDPPPPPRIHKPDILPALEEIILRALEKDPSARYQTAAALRRQLLVALGEDAAAEVEPPKRDEGDEPPDATDDARTAPRDQPPAVLQITARTLVAEGVAPRSSARGDDDEHDPVTRVVKPDSETALRDGSRGHPEVDDPATMELDTVAGPTMRRDVGDLRGIIDAALQVAGRPRASQTGTLTEAAVSAPRPAARPTPAPAAHASAVQASAAQASAASAVHPVAAHTGAPRISAPRISAVQPRTPDDTNEIAADETPFLDRSRAPRPLARTASLHVEELGAGRQRPGATVISEEEDETNVSQVPPTPQHKIADEDSEGSIATVVSTGTPSKLEEMVMAARLAVEAQQAAAAQSSDAVRQRTAALSVTKQSEFGMMGLLSQQAAPPVAVIPAAEHAPSSSLSYEHPLEPPRAARESMSPPNTQWPPPTQGRRAANELEDLLKQMPQQRQPILSSMVVIVLLGLAIVVLVWLLVGAATF